MKLIGSFTLLVGIVSTLLLSGCNRNANTAAQPAKPTPEESFAHIVETFRRGVEDVSIGFLVPDSTGYSRMTGKNQVSHELIPPAKPEDPYRAVITVSSESRYSIQRSTEEKKEQDEKDAAEQEKRDPLAETDDSGVEILDPDLISKPSETAKDPKAAEPSEKVVVARRPNKDERKYELVYVNGRWTLAPGTKFDLETEQSIKNAFDRALRTQG